MFGRLKEIFKNRGIELTVKLNIIANYRIQDFLSILNEVRKFMKYYVSCDEYECSISIKGFPIRIAPHDNEIKIEYTLESILTVEEINEMINLVKMIVRQIRRHIGNAKIDKTRLEIHVL